MKNELKDEVEAYLKYCYRICLAGILSNLRQNLLCAWKANLERPKDYFWYKNQKKSFGNIFKALNKNEQILTAAECRMYCKSEIMAGNFDLQFAFVLVVM